MAGHQLIIGSKGFPGTNHTWRFIQDAFAIPIKAFCRMAGHKAILNGILPTLTPVDAPQNYSAGFVVYNDELLPFESGAEQATVTIIETIENAEYANDANNDGQNDVLPTYKTRYMRFGTGGVTTFPFSDLYRVQTLKQLSQFTLPGNLVIDAAYVHTDNNLTDAILTYLNSLVSNVQANWDAAPGTIAAILNKPTNLKTFLKRGSLIVGDVIPGDYTVTFNTVGTINYKVDINFEALSAATAGNTATVIYSVHSKTQTSFKIRLNETGNQTQNLKIFWELVPSA